MIKINFKRKFDGNWITLDWLIVSSDWLKIESIDDKYETEINHLNKKLDLIAKQLNISDEYNELLKDEDN